MLEDPLHLLNSESCMYFSHFSYFLGWLFKLTMITWLHFKPRIVAPPNPIKNEQTTFIGINAGMYVAFSYSTKNKMNGNENSHNKKYPAPAASISLSLPTKTPSPSSTLTWQLEIAMFKRKHIFKMAKLNMSKWSRWWFQPIWRILTMGTSH